MEGMHMQMLSTCSSSVSQIIYVARNPSDVAVSFYHLNRLYRTQGYVGDFETFYNYFEKDLSK